MNPELKQQFERYAQLKVQEKLLSAEIDSLQPVLLQALKDSGMDKAQGEMGTFTLAKRRTWKYTEAVEQADSALKSLKKAEEASGSASYTESESIRFISNDKKESSEN